MKALAQFVMRGRSQAALVATVCAMLSLILPLFGLISSAVVALVTLRGGVREGALVVALAALACGVIAALALGAPLVSVALLVLLWLPVWGLAALLRLSRSLALTLQVGAVAGLVVVLIIRLLLDDPAAAWLSLLQPLQDALVKDGMVEPEAAEAVIGEVARWMTGTVAAALVLQWLVGLFIGRWWQALLYNPGGFGEEFRLLRLSRWLGVAGLVLLVAIGFQRGAGPVSDVLLVLSVLWLFQGLAVIHALHRNRGLSVGWLVGIYCLLVLFMPHAELLVACIGLVDIGADIRARLITRPSAPED